MLADKEQKVLVEVKNCKLHSLANGIKHTLANGKCTLSTLYHEDTENKLILLNINTFYHTFEQQNSIIRIKYPSSTTYLIKSYNGWNALSYLDSKSNKQEITNKNTFLTILKDHNLLIQYNSQQTVKQFKYELQQVYPGIQLKQLYKKDSIMSKVSSIKKGFGSVFGTIANYITDKPSNQSEQDGIPVQSDDNNENKIYESNKCKANNWQHLKNKINKVTIQQKGYKLFNTVHSSINKAHKQSVKYVDYLKNKQNPKTQPDDNDLCDNIDEFQYEFQNVQKQTNKEQNAQKKNDNLEETISDLL